MLVTLTNGGKIEVSIRDGEIDFGFPMVYNAKDLAMCVLPELEAHPEKDFCIHMGKPWFVPNDTMRSLINNAIYL